MMVKLSKRLQKIAEMVKFDTLVDVGSDHAHLPIFLATSGRVKAALAADIAPGPLATGRQNAAAAGVCHMVDFCLSDGLLAVNSGVYDTCVIAGMGGENIIKILKQSPNVAVNFKQLLLSPHRDTPILRRFLHENSFSICDEAMVREKGKFYNILDCKPQATQVRYDKTGYTFGEILINTKDTILFEFIETEIEKISKFPKPLRVELLEYLKLCEEVKKCL